MSANPLSTTAVIGQPPGGRFQTCDHAPDVLVQVFGPVTILWPRTPEAKAWFSEHVDSRETWGVGTVCEPRFVEPIVASLVAAGFEVIRSA
jgi:hypothetical protein